MILSRLGSFNYDGAGKDGQPADSYLFPSLSSSMNFAPKPWRSRKSLSRCFISLLYRLNNNSAELTSLAGALAREGWDSMHSLRADMRPSSSGTVRGFV